MENLQNANQKKQKAPAGINHGGSKNICKHGNLLLVFIQAVLKRF